MLTRIQSSLLKNYSYIGKQLKRTDVAYNSLNINNNVIAEYIWIGGYAEDHVGFGNMLDIRSKTKVVNKKEIRDVSELPEWNYDGSSTGQAPGNDSEIYLRPQKIYKDPFRGGNNLLVFCDTQNGANKEQPNFTNNRYWMNKIFEATKDKKPTFGLEQEQNLMQIDSFPMWPLGWPSNGFPRPQGPFQCSVGAGNNQGREIADAHLKACLYCGLGVSGLNAEVMPGQYEFQIGPVEGIDASDQMWLARQLLKRISEDYDVAVSFAPKPVQGDWNGAGMHTNYSDVDTMVSYEAILEAIKRLEKGHMKHIEVYGAENGDRMTGKHETSHISEFSHGVANRGCSVRIPRETFHNKKGYLEDRRPASNIDPYLVTGALVDTILYTKGNEIESEIWKKMLGIIRDNQGRMLLDLDRVQKKQKN